MSENKCFFNFKFACEKKSEKLSVAGAQRIKTIIKCSKVYEDQKFEELEEKTSSDKDFYILCHRSCVSIYTSKSHLKRCLSPGNAVTEAGTSTTKMQRRSEVPNFNFKNDCLYRGQQCEVEKNKKNPHRWRPSFQFRAVEYKVKKISIKEAILQTCVERNDAWAAEIRLRLAGCVADLPAVDARYHMDCRNKFMGQNAVLSAKRQSSQDTDEEDIPYEETVKEILADKERIWNSIDINNIYSDRGGHKLTRGNLIKALKTQFDELMVLSAPGYANIITFPNKVATTLRISRVEDDADDIETAIGKITKEIKREVADIKRNKEKYNLHVKYETVLADCSKTLLKFCESLSPKLAKTPPALLIGSIVSLTLSLFTNLQIGVGVKFRFLKELVNILNQFKISCTYDELLRFKKSAAFEVVKNVNLPGITKGNDATLTQVIVDNFDTEISSQNGKTSTHSLAVLAAQTTSAGEFLYVPQNHNVTETKRVPKGDISKKLDYETNVVRYYGPKKPIMPLKVSKKNSSTTNNFMPSNFV